MKPIADFWRKSSLGWEQRSYGKEYQNLSIVEKLAAFFGRRPIQERRRVALGLIKPYIKDKKVLEIGCAGGNFVFELLANGASKAIGVDVSDEAIALASQKAKLRGFAQRCAFFAATADSCSTHIKEPVDIVTGLGILEYLEPAEIKKFLKDIKAPYFLFSFNEKRTDLISLLHCVYRRCKNLPFFASYSEKEMRYLFESCGYSDIQTTRYLPSTFISNLGDLRRKN
ncbi:MAG: class I SAM-dependent methyltransferase [Elusimicrobia bacterium]|nr:class I SAM-dependent methyltransferase [Elusimicrobiota bacterium]